MTEAEFIATEQRKLDTKFGRWLDTVNRTGEIGRKAGEHLLVCGMISFGGPRPEIGNPYNCYRLTEQGVEELVRIRTA